MMDIQTRLDLAKDQLDRVLGFFSRVDAKSSIVLAIDTAMLAFLFAQAPALDQLQGWIMLTPAITLILLTVSMGYLYKQGAPSLNGGHQSLIYFREIANRTEANYIDEFIATSEEKYLKDILGQIWRNSEILKEKFDHLESALTALGLAILPWIISIALFATRVAPVANS